MAVFKVVSKYNGKQVKKKVYETKDKFDKYSPDLINRWSDNYDIEVYELINDIYKFLYKIETPKTKEEIIKWGKEKGYRECWVEYRIKNL